MQRRLNRKNSLEAEAMDKKDKRNLPEALGGEVPITQRQWRRVGAGAIFGAAVMAWYGQYLVQERVSFVAQAVYWGVFLLLLLVALYVVLLDIRYIRLQYAIERRDAFLRTLGSEELRKAISARQSGGNGKGEAEKTSAGPATAEEDAE